MQTKFIMTSPSPNPKSKFTLCWQNGLGSWVKKSFYRRSHNCGHKDTNSHRDVRAAIISGNPGLGTIILMVITISGATDHVRGGLAGDWRGGELENLIIAQESNCAVKTGNKCDCFYNNWTKLFTGTCLLISPLHSRRGEHQEDFHINGRLIFVKSSWKNDQNERQLEYVGTLDWTPLLKQC